MQSKKQY